MDAMPPPPTTKTTSSSSGIRTERGATPSSASHSQIDRDGDNPNHGLSLSLDRLSLRDHDGDEVKRGDDTDANANDDDDDDDDTNEKGKGNGTGGAVVQFVDYRDESQLSDVMGLVDGDLSEPYSIFTYRYFLHQWPELCTLAMLNGKAVGCVICKIDEEDVPLDAAGVDLEHDAAVTTTAVEGGGGAEEEGGGNGNEDEVPPPESESASASTAAGATTAAETERPSSSNYAPPTDAAPATAESATPPPTNSARATRKKRTGYMAMLAVSDRLRRSGIGTALVCRAVERMRRAEGCTSVVLETEVTNVAAMRLYERLGFMREELLVKYYLNWGDAYRLRLWFDDDDDHRGGGGGGDARAKADAW